MSRITLRATNLTFKQENDPLYNNGTVFVNADDFGTLKAARAGFSWLHFGKEKLLVKNVEEKGLKKGEAQISLLIRKNLKLPLGEYFELEPVKITKKTALLELTVECIEESQLDLDSQKEAAQKILELLRNLKGFDAGDAERIYQITYKPTEIPDFKTLFFRITGLIELGKGSIKEPIEIPITTQFEIRLNDAMAVPPAGSIKPGDPVSPGHHLFNFDVAEKAKELKKQFALPGFLSLGGLEDELDFVRKILQGVKLMGSGVKFSIIHGPMGTGKSTLVKVLVSEGFFHLYDATDLDKAYDKLGGVADRWGMDDDLNVTPSTNSHELIELEGGPDLAFLVSGAGTNDVRLKRAIQLSDYFRRHPVEGRTRKVIFLWDEFQLATLDGKPPQIGQDYWEKKSEIKDLLQAVKNESRNNIAVVAVTKEYTDLDKNIREMKALDIEVGLPDDCQRRAIMEIEARNYDRNFDIDRTGDFWKRLAEKSHGFTPRDIENAFHSATKNAMARYERDPTPANLKLTLEDISKAFHSYQPAGLEAHPEVRVSRPENDWRDFVIHEAVKYKLLQLVNTYINSSPRINNTILLYGLNGTGKSVLPTYMNRIDGKTLRVITISGTVLTTGIVGGGRERLENALNMASKYSPCIVFVDNLEAIGTKVSAEGGSANMDRANTLILLKEWLSDSHPKGKNLFFVAATNRPRDIDKDLLEKFKLKIHMRLPYKKRRSELFERYTRDLTRSGDIDYGRLADETKYYTGNDIKMLIEGIKTHWQTLFHDYRQIKRSYQEWRQKPGNAGRDFLEYATERLNSSDLGDLEGPNLKTLQDLYSGISATTDGSTVAIKRSPFFREYIDGLDEALELECERRLVRVNQGRLLEAISNFGKSTKLEDIMNLDDFESNVRSGFEQDVSFRQDTDEYLKEMGMDESTTRKSEIVGLDPVIRTIMGSLGIASYLEVKGQGSSLDLGKGVLLYGPRGTGKTSIAKVLAGPDGMGKSGHNWKFMNISYSELPSPPLRVDGFKRLFNLAKARPPCIIFIDEIDQIFSEDKDGREMSNFLKEELDGLGKSKSNIYIVATTNFPKKIAETDSALLRKGRIGSSVFIPLPNEEARRQIFVKRVERIRAKDGIQIELSPEELNFLAKESEGMNASSINAAFDSIVKENLEEHITDPSTGEIVPQRRAPRKEMAFGQDEELTLVDNTRFKGKKMTGGRRQRGGAREWFMKVLAGLSRQAVTYDKAQTNEFIDYMNDYPPEIEDEGYSKLVESSMKMGTQLKTSFKDIAGYDDLKQVMINILERFSMDPATAKAEGQGVGKGMILYGPPGTGKSFMASAMAKEALERYSNVKVEILEKGDFETAETQFVGQAEVVMDRVFKRIENKQPCIVLIDEIDSIFPNTSQGIGVTSGGIAMAREEKFLTKLDGVRPGQRMFIIGATNNLWNLAPRLYRDGRLDLRVLIPLPTADTRQKLLLHYLKKSSNDGFQIEGLRRDDPDGDDVTMDNLEELVQLTKGAGSSTFKKLIEDAQNTVNGELEQVHGETLNELRRDDLVRYHSSLGDYREVRKLYGAKGITKRISYQLLKRSLDMGFYVDEDDLQRYLDFTFERVNFSVVGPTYKKMILDFEKEFTGGHPETTWNDLGGLHFMKRLFQETIVKSNDPAYRARLEEAGAGRTSIMNAILLYGVGGTGKTSIAQALANDIGIKFREVKTSKLQTEEDVDKLFHSAGLSPDGVILFFDECTGLFPSTSFDPNDPVNTRPTGSSLTDAFKRNMEGFVRRKNVYIICATNSPERLDENVLSRFGYKLLIPLPTTSDRKEVLEKQIRKAGRFKSQRNWESSEFFVREVADRSDPNKTVYDQAELEAKGVPDPKNPKKLISKLDRLALKTNGFSNRELTKLVELVRTKWASEGGLQDGGADSDCRDITFDYDRLSSQSYQRVDASPAVADPTLPITYGALLALINRGTVSPGSNKTSQGRCFEFFTKNSPGLDDDEYLRAITESGLEGNEETPNVSWDDIGGLEHIKRLVMQKIVRPRERPGLKEMKKMNGFLLYGPPGTGKTLVAKAMATQLGFKVQIVKATDILNMWGGNSEKNIEQIFTRAKATRPGCILIFDEIDKVLSGGGTDGSGWSETKNSIIGIVQTQMDGVSDSSMGNPVIVLGTTNYPENLPPAIMSRLPNQCYVGLPNFTARQVILRKELGRLKQAELYRPFLADQARVDKVVRQLKGFSGRDISWNVIEAVDDRLIDIRTDCEEEVKGQLVAQMKAKGEEIPEWKLDAMVERAIVRYLEDPKVIHELINKVIQGTGPSVSRDAMRNVLRWCREHSGDQADEICQPGDNDPRETAVSDSSVTGPRRPKPPVLPLFIDDE
jgi:SpoVK/Ycf46/Vps4 family AAA+-type ATPase